MRPQMHFQLVDLVEHNHAIWALVAIFASTNVFNAIIANVDHDEGFKIGVIEVVVSNLWQSHALQLSHGYRSRQSVMGKHQQSHLLSLVLYQVEQGAFLLSDKM
jgi:hypothetical protein